MGKSFNFSNGQIASLLRNVAAAYEVKTGNRFKIMAYDRAATAIEHATSEIKDLWDDKSLGAISGIGQNIGAHLDELFRTGKVKHFNAIFSGLPPAMFEFLRIPGIGAKTAFKLSKKLKITKKEEALEKLRQAAKAEKIRIIEGFGEQSEMKILEGMAQFGRREKRLVLPYAYSYAQKVLEHLKKCPQVLKADTLGSLRRHCATIGDIDIAVAGKDNKKIIAWFLKYPKLQKIVESGDNKARILLPNDVQVDLMVEPPESYGSLLQHFTGSKQHNIALREIAMKKGMSVSEHGIKQIKNSHFDKSFDSEGRALRFRLEELSVMLSKVEASKLKIKNYPNEENFYKALGMQWIPPELREDSGEIELAQKNQLPKLVELVEIKGDLHIHSNFNIETSHDLGESSLTEIYEKAEKLGYEYFALSEHNPSSSQHKEKEFIDLIKRKKEYIEKFLSSRTTKVFIFNSLEIDIKPNGERAIPDTALELLDFGIVSVHSSFRLPKKEMTQRILRALTHPKVKILGHPTGRKLLAREGYELDWDKIFDFCLRNQKYLEVNCWPERLDLPDFLIKEAVKAGIKLIISTDSHKIGEMNLMKYGVWTARRGWAKNGDIMNTLGYNEFKLKMKNEK